MNLHELDTYKLSDAVKFHNRLNPKLWGQDEKLLPEVRSKLLEIAADFQEFLGISDLEVKDITLSGSNAAYSYTPHSDIDLHLVVEQPQQDDEVYQELFNAKKYQYNDLHDIRIRGADVELYVQPANEPAVSLGEYSVLNDQWIEVPKRKRAKIDQTLVRHKYEDLQNRIQAALKENDSDRVQALINKIKAMRQSGLDQHGEFGPENLAFKMLRKQGWIKRLYDHVAAAKDRELSLREQEPKKLFKYGFGSGPEVDDVSDYRALFKPSQPKEPAVADLQFKTAQDYEWFKKQQQKKKELASEDASSTWDGVNPTTCMFLNEVEADPEPVVHEFIKSVADQLGIEKLPTIEMHTDPQWSVTAHSFGRYDPKTHTLNVSLANRHLLDILRTVAHELTHCRQNQAHPLPDDAGETGSRWENQANAQAGIFMRDFAAAHPEYFENKPLGESAAGYIPTKKQARDPRYSMALTVDIKPGQVGKEANKMKLDTDSQGHPEMVYQSVNQLHESLSNQLAYEFSLLEDQYLGEIKMSPSNLRAEAAKTGAQAGMEFEMIVPGAGSIDNDGDQEPDWDQDERVRGFSSIRNFFHDGDHNNRRAVDRLEQQLIDDYYNSDWLSEKKLEEWGEVAEQHISDLVERDYEDDLREQAREEVMDNTPEFGVNSEELSAAVEQRYEELRDAKINEIMANMGREYDEAYEEWEQNEWQDMANSDEWQDEWLDDQGITTMQDVQSNYDITWPYYTSVEEEADIDAIADDFSNAIGRPVNAASEYHGARREAGTYVVEPDPSLEGDNDDDAGLEFVSPPMPIDEMTSDLNKIKAWADREGCYTNNSTGLHINISVPNYSLEKLDYVKLALLLGDRYILDQYGRASNAYTKSALGKVQDKIKQQPDTAKAMLDKMRNGMEQLASKAIHSGSTDKYTSINTKSGYIEFRSPGGDWLNENFDKIENTLLRFTVALSAAMDPEAYRQEYLKKLYKLLEPTAVETKNPDTIKYFADYVAGKTPRAALRSFVKQAQLERKVKRDPTGGQQYWWEVSRPGYFASIEVVASSKEEAIDKAIEPGNYPDWARSRNTLQAKPIRPYDSSPVRASAGEPEAIGQRSGPTVGGRASNPEGIWILVRPGENPPVPLFRFNASGVDDANNVVDQWNREHPGIEAVIFHDARQAYGQPPVPGSTLDLQRQRAAQAQSAETTSNGEWGLWAVGPQRFARLSRNDGAPLRRFDNEEQGRAWLAAQRGLDPDRFDIRRIPANYSSQDAAPASAPADNLSRGFENHGGDLTPRGPGPWEIYRISNGETVRDLSGITSRSDAERAARNALGIRGEAPQLYGVRTRQQAQSAPGPLGAGRELIPGMWNVLIDGQHVFRVPGATQGEANQAARQWILGRSAEFLRDHQGGEVEVVPAWREA